MSLAAQVLRPRYNRHRATGFDCAAYERTQELLRTATDAEVRLALPEFGVGVEFGDNVEFGIDPLFPIPTDNQTVDLDSTLGVSATGGLVDSFTSQAAGSYVWTASGVNRPSLISAAGPDGADIIRGDGSNDIMSGTTFGNIISASAFTCYGVIKPTNLADANLVLCGDVNNRMRLLGTGSATTDSLRHTQVRNRNGGATQFTDVATPGAVWMVVTTYHESGNIGVEIHGGGSSSIASGDTDAGELAATVLLFGRTVASANWAGDVRRILVYDAAHDSDTRAALRETLAVTYGVPA